MTLPVTVVSGFLGAGKTTLVNRWLTQGERGDVAVIVNEQGAVGVDGELLRARARVLVEITGGCVCCTTQAELVRALEELASSATPPRRIVVETSGAASPAGVLRAIASGVERGSCRLDGVIAVFDATRLDAVLEQGIALEQLGFADIIVLSRADACSLEELARAEARLRRQNGAALFVAAARGEIQDSAAASLEALLELRQTSELAPGPSFFAPVAHDYESVSLLLEGDVDGELFAEFVESELARFAGRIFRSKGILAVAGLEVRMIVQGVLDSVEIEFGEPWGTAPRTSRLVVIGFGLDVEALQRGFAATGAS